jgi:enamine deaminase RidA (YjgF/YER057c/UK114 family)
MSERSLHPHQHFNGDDMRHVFGLAALVFISAIGATPTQAQAVVKRIQTEGGRIASGVWVNDMFYLSGQLPTPKTPADTAKGTPAVYGNTQEQSENVFMKIQNALKEQGLGLGDVVTMRVFLAADPAMGAKFDSAGMNTAYAKFFGTPEQPNKPARATVGVAALVAAGALVEIEVQAARSK